MGMFDAHNPGALTFGLLDNVISFIFFLAPIPTFYRIWKKKSTEGFSSVPYVVSLFSAMLWIYYATLKSNVSLLITIKAFGCFIETLYIVIFLAFGTKQARIAALRLLILMNFLGFCAILLITHFITKGPNRPKVIGWICLTFSISVFAAPLSILVLGFIFGIVQMILHAVYKNSTPIIKDVKIADDVKLSELQVDIQKLGTPTHDSKTEDHHDKNSEEDPLSKC